MVAYILSGITCSIIILSTKNSNKIINPFENNRYKTTREAIQDLKKHYMCKILYKDKYLVYFEVHEKNN